MGAMGLQCSRVLFQFHRAAAKPDSVGWQCLSALANQSDGGVALYCMYDIAVQCRLSRAWAIEHHVDDKVVLYKASDTRVYITNVVPRMIIFDLD